MWDFDNGWFNRFLPAVPMTDVCKYLCIKDLRFLPTVEMTIPTFSGVEGNGGFAAVHFHLKINFGCHPDEGRVS